MKGLLLELDYVDRGFVGVLQSSRYVQGTLDDARRGAEEDAAILQSRGFQVVREKIEAASTNPGVPRTPEDARSSPPDRYFEFHVLVDGKSGPISNDDVASLRSIARSAGERLGQPVPLSYNALKPAQRFLNLRQRGVGLDLALTRVREIEDELSRTGTLEVRKVISEYICFDTNLSLDDGWLEPLP